MISIIKLYAPASWFRNCSVSVQDVNLIPQFTSALTVFRTLTSDNEQWKKGDRGKVEQTEQRRLVGPYGIIWFVFCNFFVSARIKFVNKLSPVILVLYTSTLSTSRLLGPRNIILNYLGHKMSSSNYKFDPLQYLFTLVSSSVWTI